MHSLINTFAIACRLANHVTILIAVVIKHRVVIVGISTGSRHM